MGNEITRRDMMKGLSLAGILIGLDGLSASGGKATPQTMP